MISKMYEFIDLTIVDGKNFSEMLERTEKQKKADSVQMGLGWQKVLSALIDEYPDSGLKNITNVSNKWRSLRGKPLRQEILKQRDEVGLRNREEILRLEAEANVSAYNQAQRAFKKSAKQTGGGEPIYPPELLAPELLPRSDPASPFFNGEVNKKSTLINTTSISGFSMPPQNASNLTGSGVEIEINHGDQDVEVNPVEVVSYDGSGEIVSYIDLNTGAAPYRYVQNNITQPGKEHSALHPPNSALQIIKVGMAPSIGGTAHSRLFQQNTQQVPGTSAPAPPKSTVRLLNGKGAAPYRYVQNNITQPGKEHSAPPQHKNGLNIINVGMAPSIGGTAHSRLLQQNTQQVPGTNAPPPPKSTVRLLNGKGGAAGAGTSAAVRAPPTTETVTSFKGAAGAGTSAAVRAPPTTETVTSFKAQAQYKLVQQKYQPVKGTSSLPPTKKVTSFEGGYMFGGADGIDANNGPQSGQSDGEPFPSGQEHGEGANVQVHGEGSEKKNKTKRKNTEQENKTEQYEAPDISEVKQRKLKTLELERNKLMNLAHNHTIARKQEVFDRELELINVKISNEKELHQLKMKHQQELFELQKNKLSN